jgi:hypothetical protein
MSVSNYEEKAPRGGPLSPITIARHRSETN